MTGKETREDEVEEEHEASSKNLETRLKTGLQTS